MVGHQRPGHDIISRFFSEIRYPVDKIRSVLIAIDNISFFDAADNHVVKRSWSVKTRLARHFFFPH